MTWLEWYNGLAKPTWTPAPATIGLIWQILYPIILLSFGFVFVQVLCAQLPWIVALPFGVNLIANLIFTPIQFGLRNLLLASGDIPGDTRFKRRVAKVRIKRLRQRGWVPRRRCLDVLAMMRSARYFWRRLWQAA